MRGRSGHPASEDWPRRRKGSEGAEARAETKDAWTVRSWEPGEKGLRRVQAVHSLEWRREIPADKD